jgi:hypothetical protein
VGTGCRASLHGGPSDGLVTDLDFTAYRFHVPRIRDDGVLVLDIYEHTESSWLADPQMYRYAGEFIPPVPDPPLLADAPPHGMRAFLRSVCLRAAERLR